MRWARFLRVKPVCNAVFWIRLQYFFRLRRRLQIFGDQGAVRGHDYSIRSFMTGRPSERIVKLIAPLAAIDQMGPDSKVLSIGCRFEADLLYLVGYGFRPENVRGLDMISYSPWIDCGNMHATAYADGSWDAVVLGWTLAYSDQPRTAAKELVRITRDGGIIAIGVTYYPPEVLKKLIEQGAPGGIPDRIQSVERILELFRPNVGHVYFNHDVPNPAKQGSCMVIFSIRKPAAH